jgi:hypothetical protein
MRYGARLYLGIVATVAGVCLLPAAALAAPPPNDNRADAQPVALPSTTDGTTVESTQEPNEPSGCSSTRGSVWYRVTPDSDGRVIVGLAANGDLDAVVDVYRVRRSQLSSVSCDTTDENGRASFAFPVGADETYLIRVAPLFNSVDDSFRLTVQLGEPEAQPPGQPLPRGGARGTLHRALNPSDAFSVPLREGVTYRFNLASRSCTPLLLYPPGTEDFESDRPVETVRCGGYTLFTPDENESGTYSLLAVASGGRGSVPYRLTAGRAGADDTAPGRFIRNYGRMRGKLNGNGLDVVDLYRFDVERRSDLKLAIRTDDEFTVTLLRAGGKVLRRGSGEINRRVAPGRYFALVRARSGSAGTYTLRRVSRTITRTSVSVEGQKQATVPPGTTTTIGVNVAPGEPGPVKIRIERFDPVFGWQFYRASRVRADSGGDAALAFRPPSVGRFRMRASYLGTRAASPSQSGYAELRVQAPLEE